MPNGVNQKAGFRFQKQLRSLLQLANLREESGKMGLSRPNPSPMLSRMGNWTLVP